MSIGVLNAQVQTGVIRGILSCSIVSILTRVDGLMLSWSLTLLRL